MAVFTCKSTIAILYNISCLCSAFGSHSNSGLCQLVKQLGKVECVRAFCLVGHVDHIRSFSALIIMVGRYPQLKRVSKNSNDHITET